jgi:hypothetical protein
VPVHKKTGDCFYIVRKTKREGKREEGRGKREGKEGRRRGSEFLLFIYIYIYIYIYILGCKSSSYNYCCNVVVI